MPEYSISPTGERFQLPKKKDYSKEFERIKESVTPASSKPRDRIGHGSRLCGSCHGRSGC